MAEERIALSAQERERLKVLHQITQGHLRQIDAAHCLRLSDRQVRRLLQRLRSAGDGGLVHGLRGRPSEHGVRGELPCQRRSRLPDCKCSCGEDVSQPGLNCGVERLIYVMGD
jgi:predicted ArsR family transcriptional regulator